MFFCFLSARKEGGEGSIKDASWFSSWAGPFTETGTQAMKLVADDGWGVYVSDQFSSIHAELRCF